MIVEFWNDSKRKCQWDVDLNLWANDKITKVRQKERWKAVEVKVEKMQKKVDEERMLKRYI